MNLLRGLSRWLGHQRWFAALNRRFLSPLDRVLYRATGGRFSIGGVAAPVLLLTTIGRRTGGPRTTPLIYVRDGANFIVSSEDFGHSRPAGWRLNLAADQRATVQVGAETFPCRARLLSEAQADRYWQRLLQVWPAHETYRQRSGQRHTFVLEVDPEHRVAPAATLTATR